MTVAFEELRVQAENDRLEMNFKCKNSVYCVYAAGVTILYFIAFNTHGSVRADRYEVLKWWAGHIETLGPSFIHAACIHCLAPSVVVPLDQIWDFIFQIGTQSPSFDCEVQSREQYLFDVVSLLKL